MLTIILNLSLCILAQNLLQWHNGTLDECLIWLSLHQCPNLMEHTARFVPNYEKGRKNAAVTKPILDVEQFSFTTEHKQ